MEARCTRPVARRYREGQPWHLVRGSRGIVRGRGGAVRVRGRVGSVSRGRVGSSVTADAQTGAQATHLARGRHRGYG